MQGVAPVFLVITLGEVTRVHDLEIQAVVVGYVFGFVVLPILGEKPFVPRVVSEEVAETHLLLVTQDLLAHVDFDKVQKLGQVLIKIF